MVWPALIAAGAQFIGSSRSNIANKKEARSNRKFQERMSSTAHQREVKDLRLAGLNPILSVNRSGASTPSGSTANIVDELGPAVQSGLQVKKLNQEILNMQAQHANIKANTENVKNKTDITETGSQVGRDTAAIYEFFRNRLLDAPSTARQIIRDQRTHQSNRMGPPENPLRRYKIKGSERPLRE